MPSHLANLSSYTCEFQNHEIPEVNSNSFIGMLYACDIPTPRELDIELKHGNTSVLTDSINKILSMMEEAKTMKFTCGDTDKCEAHLLLILGFLYKKQLNIKN